MKSLLFPSCLALAVSAALADGVLISHTMPPAQLLHLDGTPVDGVSASASPGELIEKAGGAVAGEQQVAWWRCAN